MGIANMRTRKKGAVALAVAASVACATQTEQPGDIYVTPEGVGGTDIGGVTGTGGSTTDPMTGTGGSTNPMTGTGGSVAGTTSTGATAGQGTGGSAPMGSAGTAAAGRASGTAGGGSGGRMNTTGGRGGRAGATAMNGQGGRAGRAAMNGQGGAATGASGCAKLSVPLDAAADKAHFVTSLTTNADLSRATITMRIYVEAGTGGVVFNYVQDSSDRFLGAAMRPAIAMSVGKWSTLTWDVGAEPPLTTGITKTAIKRIGIEVNASGSTAWTSPTVIYVDSITVTTPAHSFTFDATATVSAMSATTDPASQALWLNSGSTDTTAARTALSWQASCP
jgi:hypothetical protein